MSHLTVVKKYPAHFRLQKNGTIIASKLNALLKRNYKRFGLEWFGGVFKPANLVIPSFFVILCIIKDEYHYFL